MTTESLNESSISIRNISKSFVQGTSKLTVINDFSCNIGAGEFLSFVGPSGCGKSTLLTIIAGLDLKYEGRLEIGGHSLAKPRISFVFQTPRLLPWRNVKDNIRFSLEATNIFPREEWDNRISDVLSIVGLLGYESAYPNQLSGGMQTRVAIARAFVTKPNILLMDEPFSNLDEINARKLRKELLSIWEKKKTTIVFVTHDINEAVFLADRILLLTPRPAKLFKEISIDIPRPRSYSNPNLFQYESTLLSALEQMLEGFTT